MYLVEFIFICNKMGTINIEEYFSTAVLLGDIFVKKGSSPLAFVIHIVLSNTPHLFLSSTKTWNRTTAIRKSNVSSCFEHQLTWEPILTWKRTIWWECIELREFFMNLIVSIPSSLSPLLPSPSLPSPPPLPSPPIPPHSLSYFYFLIYLDTTKHGGSTRKLLKWVILCIWNMTLV